MVIAAGGKLVCAMFNAMVFFVAQISQSIIGSKSIGKQACLFGCLARYNRHYLGNRAIFDYLGIDFTPSFKHAKNRRLSTRTTPPNTTHALSPKIAFIQLYFTFCKRTEALESSLMRLRIAANKVLIVGRLTLVMQATLEASISMQNKRTISLNLASEILERMMYLFFIVFTITYYHCKSP